MKKILLFTAAVTTLPTITLADSILEDNQFYFRGDVGLTYTNKDNIKSSMGDTKFNIKIKPKLSPSIDAGIGGYLLDNIRAEIIYNHPFLSSFKGSHNINLEPVPTPPALPAVGDVYSQKLEVNSKPLIHAAFGKITGDLIDFGVGKLFFTGGAGMARIKNSMSVRLFTNVGVPGAGGNPTIHTETESSKTSKTSTNFVWMIGGGSTFDIAEKVHLDITYSYRDYGKTKSVKFYEATISALHIRTHNISAGIRIDI